MFCDDSMAIIATDTGGELIPCPGAHQSMPDGTPAATVLSYAEVDTIRERFNDLNPYNRDQVPDVLKLEETGWS